MRSIQQDSAQGRDWPGRLCPECGLCCNGVLFADVRLERADDALELQAAGLALALVRGRPAFSQPCRCFDGRLCRIYPERPGRCRGFDCYTLQRLDRGELDLAGAQKRVRDALRRTEDVRRLLRKLGQTDESIPLTHRYRTVMEQPVDLSKGGKSADLRGELMLSMGRLMDFLHREFLNHEKSLQAMQITPDPKSPVRKRSRAR